MLFNFYKLQYIVVTFILGVLYIGKINAQTAAQLACSQRLTKNTNTPRFNAANSRSDTIDILNYHIFLDISDIGSKTISGNCVVTFVPKKNNVSQLILDLEALMVSTVSVNNQNANFVQQGTQLKIELPQAFNPTDTVLANITYNGSPIQAQTGFGGFYFTSTYAYNLGVGIGIDPPAYGRVWFPCFDNFVEKSTYNFDITTASNNVALCNGALLEIDTLANSKKVFKWAMLQPIPSYLASVAVAPYMIYNQVFMGNNGSVPAQFGVLPADTTKLKQSFVNLEKCFQGFEKKYGTYQFNRVGYVFVPFNGGAMEHATNIAFPKAMINGTLTYEDIMAHEFSHHWWGNLMTCETPADMWLNEGWASYSEKLFFEYVYGKNKYKEKVRSNHLDVLENAHLSEGGFQALSPIPFEYTYGAHTYQKGADMAHTLRGYFNNNDSLFFDCLQNFLTEYAFKNANSNDFKDFLIQCSGINAIQNYFDTWVFKGGFPHFSIDSIKTNANNEVAVFIRQKLYGATEYAQNVPLEITFFDQNFNKSTHTVSVSGECNVAKLNIDFTPTAALLDLNEQISDATIDNFVVLKTAQTHNFTDTKVSLATTALESDSALVQVTHHYVAPDRNTSPPTGYILSPNHYWSVQGMGNVVGTLSFTYNAAANGYLDAPLFSGNITESNLAIFYRPNTHSNWVQPTQNINTQGSTTDKKGKIDVTNFGFGEYALGVYAPNAIDTVVTHIPENCFYVGINTPYVVDKKNNTTQLPILKIFPNPSYKKMVNVELPATEKNTVALLQITSVEGKIVSTQKIELMRNIQKISVETKHLKRGVYLVQLIDNETLMPITQTQKLIIK